MPEGNLVILVEDGKNSAMCTCHIHISQTAGHRFDGSLLTEEMDSCHFPAVGN